MKKKIKENNIKKNFIWNILGSTLNSFNSFFFLVIATRINGENISGMFSFAFSSSLMFYHIGTYCGRVFQVADNSDASDNDYLCSKGIMSFLMILVCLMFVFLRGYTGIKLVILLSMYLFKTIDAFMDCIYAIFQKHECLYKAGISMFLKSIISIILFLIVDIITKNIILSILSMLLVYILLFILYDLKELRLFTSFKNKINFKKVKSILRRGFDPFIFSFLMLFIINASKYGIDFLNNDVLQNSYGILIMPGTVLQLLESYLLQPYIVKIKNMFVKKDINLLNKFINKFCLVLFSLCLVALVFAIFLGIPVLNFVYNINLNSYKIDFVILFVGSIFYAIILALSYILTTLQENRVQVYAFLGTSIFTLIFSYFLINKYEIRGASINYTVTMFILFLEFLIMKFFIIKKLKKESRV